MVKKKPKKRSILIKPKAQKSQKPEQELVKKTKIRVVGVGGGAGNIVSEIASRVKKASFVAANTDSQALKSLHRTVLPFQFGENITHGLGTGMNLELARTAAISEKEKIKKLFQGYDFCILISSLGGGVSSGAAPIFANIAKNSGAISLGVFTLPFKFEGEKKQELAKEALQKLRQNLSALVVLPNDRVFQIIEKTTPLKEALSFLNKNLADALQSLIEIIYEPGLINIDFADLKAILQGFGKIAYLNTAQAQGEGSALSATKQVLNSPLYPYTIKGAKRVLFNITGGKDMLISDVSEISKMIFEQAFSQAQIIFGISQNQTFNDKIKVSILATGCQAKIFSNGQKETPKKTEKRKKEKQIPQAKPAPTLKHRPEKRRKSKPKQKKLKVEVKEEKPAEKFRKSALQIKQEAAEEEKEFLEKEKFWETPSFLRKKRM